MVVLRGGDVSDERGTHAGPPSRDAAPRPQSGEPHVFFFGETTGLLVRIDGSKTNRIEGPSMRGRQTPSPRPWKRHPTGHLWRDKWTTLSGPLSEQRTLCKVTPVILHGVVTIFVFSFARGGGTRACPNGLQDVQRFSSAVSTGVPRS